jgi:hypothetical protein
MINLLSNLTEVNIHMSEQKKLLRVKNEIIAETSSDRGSEEG